MNSESNILVIEDNESIREDVGLILGMEGFGVELARDGIEGLDRALSGQFDLILCDIMMPGMDGFELLERFRTEIRQDPSHENENVPFVFLTARSAREDQRKGMDMGAEDFLTKPFTAEELLNMIRARISHAKFRRNGTSQGLSTASAVSAIKEIMNNVIGPSLLLQVSLDRYNDYFHIFGRDTITEIKKAYHRKLSEFAKSDILPYQEDSLLLIADDPGQPGRADLFKQIQSALPGPCSNCNSRVHMTASIAAVPFVLSDNNGESPVDPASGSPVDFASLFFTMNQAKEQGGNNSVVFESGMKDRIMEDAIIEEALYAGIHTDSFEVYLQPRIDLKTDRVCAAELLLRWQHPQMGMISPIRFIPILEKSGLIEPIGMWVIQQAIEIKNKLDAHSLPGIRLSVNLSGRQLVAEDFHELLEKAFAHHGIEESKNAIEFEITESMMINGVPEAMQTLERLHAAGFTIHIDDFGTGYSSLASLRSIPARGLKIDRAFVRDLSASNGRALLGYIFHLAEELGLSTIAEGVETLEQLDAIRAMDCDEVQGFYYSPPLPIDQFIEYAGEQNPTSYGAAS